VTSVPLLLVDLDNTLIESTAAFARWAAAFTKAQNGTAEDTAWMIAANRDGYENRERFAVMIAGRFGLPDDAVLADTLRFAVVDNIVFDDAVADALDAARHEGWTPFVITNGNVAQQERKLRRTGLDKLVAGWVISEGVGLRKPDPEIFREAARRAGQPLDGAWMIGDADEYDIAGAVNAGIESVWLHRGREWGIPAYRPTRMAASFPEAVSLVRHTARS
jgi:putative hydrolase of the HAD superfamily